ncbi:ALP1-like protein [Tanacetum coccineum]
MAIFVVSISSDSSEESVGTSTVRVILFGTVYTAIPATVPIIYPPVVHDDTPLILTETPTIPPVVSTLPHNSPFMYGELGSQTGANNDLTILNNSPLFDDLLDDIAPVAPFEVDGVAFKKGYYLADGIHQTWETFVKSFSVARDEKNVVFKRRQENARKDVERAFGV